MRPISNVVDVTNYVLLERNQPLHAFDLDRLAGPGIIVRLAEPRRDHDDARRRRPGPSTPTTCSSATPNAPPGPRRDHGRPRRRGHRRHPRHPPRVGLLRADGHRPQLEAPEAALRIQRPVRARHRPRRRRDQRRAGHGARSPTSPPRPSPPTAVDQYPRPVARPRIALRTSRVNAILGTDLTATAVLDALRPLEITVQGDGDDIVAIPPTFRPDLTREIDLIEEVARTDRVRGHRPRASPDPTTRSAGSPTAQRDRRTIADALVGAGLPEATTVPLVAPATLAEFGTTDAVALANPLRADESVLRSALRPRAARHRRGERRPRSTRPRPLRARHRLPRPRPTGTPLPTERLARRRRAHRPRPAPPAGAGPARRRRRRRRPGPRRGRRARPRPVDARTRPCRRLPADRARRASSSHGGAVGHAGELGPPTARSRRPGVPDPSWRSSSTSRARRRAPTRPRLPRACHPSRRRRSTSTSWSTSAVPAGDDRRDAARRGR